MYLWNTIFTSLLCTVQCIWLLVEDQSFVNVESYESHSTVRTRTVAVQNQYALRLTGNVIPVALASLCRQVLNIRFIHIARNGTIRLETNTTRNQVRRLRVRGWQRIGSLEYRKSSDFLSLMTTHSLGLW